MRLYVVLGFLLISCRTSSAGFQTKAGVLLPEGLGVQIVEEDAIYEVTSGDYVGLKFTKINPAPGQGDKDFDSAGQLCRLLSYGGELSWRMIKREELGAISSLGVDLISGFDKVVWGMITVEVDLRESQAEYERLSGIRVIAGGLSGQIRRERTESLSRDIERLEAVDPDLRALTPSYGGQYDLVTKERVRPRRPVAALICAKQ